MSSTRIGQLIEGVQAAFDRRPAEVEEGLAVEDAALLQLRKACRLLAGAETLDEAGYYTLVVEASFLSRRQRSSLGWSDIGDGLQQCLPVLPEGSVGEFALGLGVDVRSDPDVVRRKEDVRG